jgi:hypothetical protein
VGDHITLDDGRILSRSSIGVSGAIQLVAEHLPDGFHNFRKWLVDVSRRSNGFASIDLRGLPEPERRVFHAGVHAAYEQTIAAASVVGPQSWALTCLAALRAMLLSIERGEPPEALTDIPPRPDKPMIAEDLGQFWNAETS